MDSNTGTVQYKVSGTLRDFLRENGQMKALRRITPGSAGLDLHADIQSPVKISPGLTYTIPTGISLDMTQCPSCAGLVLIRSGVSGGGLLKAEGGPSFYLANQVGLIDNDYQGEIMLMLRTRNIHGFVLEPMTRIAQIVLFNFFSPVLEQVEHFAFATRRGANGFGSTGV